MCRILWTYACWNGVVMVPVKKVEGFLKLYHIFYYDFFATPLIVLQGSLHGRVHGSVCSSVAYC